jgi:hypothetical protein
MTKATTIIDGAAEMVAAIIADERHTRDDAEGFAKRYIYDGKGEMAYTVDIDRGTITYFAFGCRNTIKVGRRNVRRMIAAIPVRG